MDAHEHRLSHIVRPSRYDIIIEPDLEQFTFTGSETVQIELEQALDEIVLNAAHLVIGGAHLEHADGRQIDAETHLDPDTERLTLKLASTADAGQWTLVCDFTGELNDRLEGFYRSIYDDPEGEKQVIATTQFEATYARQAFPCWDQPDMKAVFGITLVVPEDMAAISNSPVEREESKDGKRTVLFKDTMVMSTYLVAFIIGKLEGTEVVDVDGVPLQVWHTPGKGHMASYALEAGAFGLRYLSDFYGIPYPGDKVDMIGIPDFSWGAMENLGAITFRETALLVDESRASQADLARVADVVAHELAHMWFGDLVTMKWWNGIWLNEAFATFMELKCVDAFRPDWKRFLAFATEGPSGRSISMDIDALETTRPIEYDVHSPEDANGMFDALTYGKGAAVLRMLEQYLGPERFRAGVKHYLERHSHGNAETDDLWHALEEVTGVSIAPMMDTWIRQGGHPLVEVESGPDGGTLVRQRHFQFNGAGDQDWQIPLLYRHIDESHGTASLSGETRIDVNPVGVVMNAGGHGFYRVQYENDLFSAIIDRLDDLDPLERYCLVADAWALVLSGDEDASTFLDLVSHFDGEDESAIWEAIAGGLGELDRIVIDGDRPTLQAFVRATAGPALERIGWSGRAGESDLDKRLRANLVSIMAVLGADEASQQGARDAFERSLQGDDVEPALAHAALAATAANGTMDDYHRFIQLWRDAATPQDVVRYLAAAVAVPHEAAADETIRLVLEGEVRSQDAHWVLNRLLANRTVGRHVWEQWKARWPQILEAIPVSLHRRVLDQLPARSEVDVAADIERFFAENPLPTAGQYLFQQLERLRIRVGLRQREEGRLAEAIGNSSSRADSAKQ
ncbi:MAG: M1 family metallopeptidase [Acidimicrobiia bacterium]|nr:M1 family metallopeptidase [Acidimicrobiia bacterium]